MTGGQQVTAPAWAAVDSPALPSGEVGHEVVTDARLTRLNQGVLRTVGRPDQWIRGAVHDRDGHLVVASQRLIGGGGEMYVAADPVVAPMGRADAGSTRLAGTWLYGGHWMDHFGHFITETLTTLWPTTPELSELLGPSEVEGIVCHGWLRPPPEVVDWQRRLVDLAGHAGRQVVFVHREPVRVERLVVPGRPYVVCGWAQGRAVDVWRRVAAAVPASAEVAGGAERVYLSRSRFNADLRAAGRQVRSSAERDADLDRDFAAAGFAVVHPETLDVEHQITLVRDASIVAGLAGSSLHLVAFAARPIRVIEVGYDRSPGRPVINQRVVNSGCGHRSAFIGRDTAAADVLAELDLTTDPGTP